MGLCLLLAAPLPPPPFVQLWANVGRKPAATLPHVPIVAKPFVRFGDLTRPAAEKSTAPSRLLCVSCVGRALVVPLWSHAKSGRKWRFDCIVEMFFVFQTEIDAILQLVLNSCRSGLSELHYENLSGIVAAFVCPPFFDC